MPGHDSTGNSASTPSAMAAALRLGRPIPSVANAMT